MTMECQPQQEHHWLHKLIGEWSFTSECSMGSDQPTAKTQGIERIRSLGGLWTIAEGECETPEGGTGNTIMTLGYDPQTQRYIGTFIASMMTHLWHYNGTLNPDGTILTLDTEGPSFTAGLTKYQDIIEWVNDDHRIMRSKILDAEGSWNLFMTAHYQRKQ